MMLNLLLFVSSSCTVEHITIQSTRDKNKNFVFPQFHARFLYVPYEHVRVFTSKNYFFIDATCIITFLWNNISVKFSSDFLSKLILESPRTINLTWVCVKCLKCSIKKILFIFLIHSFLKAMLRGQTTLNG